MQTIELGVSGERIRIQDSRAFHAGNRAFCRRLVDFLARQPGVRAVRLDLESSTCGIEFADGTRDPAVMSGTVAAGIRAAVTAGPPPAGGGRSGRRERPWSALAAFSGETGPSLWELQTLGPDRLRIRASGPPDVAAAWTPLMAGLGQVPGVRSSRPRWRFRDLVVEFEPGQVTLGHVLRAVPAPAPGPTGPAEAGGASPLASGLKRYGYLALAGGSFVMAVVGLIVPGIPTVPFLLATSYFLARSSPALDRRLRRSRFFGPILREWSAHRTLSRHSKRRLIGLTAAIVLVAVALAPLNPVALVVMLVFVALSLSALARIPELPDDEAGFAPAPIGALPAPVS